ncbi:zinc finger CW-type PWWP domain protein 1-like [Coccinella septempunctata]|uniref:zinc finger CW-type PWWP domain protein 1-like n=1 Tax=Coccinella septempunctata TaxID=41139 RepID=UPI001D09988D|nr:zinc finger CW-type PWWP domain protein 1-like [Coccinella septempunctata]
MPLYRKRPKKSFLSQDAPTDEIISAFKFKQPSEIFQIEEIIPGKEAEKREQVGIKISETRNEDQKQTSHRTISKYPQEGILQEIVDNIDVISSLSDEINDMFSETHQEGNNMKTEFQGDGDENSKKKKSNNLRYSQAKDKKKELLNSTKGKEDRSSQRSMNRTPVKEAFKQFLLQKETKLDESLISSQSSDISLNDPIIRETYSQFIGKKDKFTRVNTPKGLTHYDKMKWLQEQRIVGVFVLCDKCDKTRYLEEIEDPTELPDKWYCEDNKDPLHNRCEIPEEKFPVHIQEDWIHNLYNAGSIVWARVCGYPWWPGMIDDDPNTESYYWLDDDIDTVPSWYHVTFFDQKQVSRAWLKPHEIMAFNKVNYNPNPDSLKFRCFKTRINFAIKQANEALGMSLRERLSVYSFLERFEKPIKKPKDVLKETKKKTLLKRGGEQEIKSRKKKPTSELKELESFEILFRL